MSEITHETIDKVARLSRLSFSARESELFAAQLSEVLRYAEKLNEIDTRNVEPSLHPHPITNVFREDDIAEGLTLRQASMNAPEFMRDCFRVPKII